MKRWGIAAAVVGAGLLLTACGGATTTATSAAPPTATSAAWSDEAVTACRTFINSVPNMALVKSEVSHYSPNMSADQLSQAKTGWGLATANVHLPAGLGVDAEPEVHQALAGVATALSTSITDPSYVQANATAFSNAITVCGKVGVTA